MSMECIYNAYMALMCCGILLGVYFISNIYVVVAGMLSVLVWFVFWGSKK